MKPYMSRKPVPFTPAILALPAGRTGATRLEDLEGDAVADAHTRSAPAASGPMVSDDADGLVSGNRNGNPVAKAPAPLLVVRTAQPAHIHTRSTASPSLMSGM